MSAATKKKHQEKWRKSKRRCRARDKATKAILELTPVTSGSINLLIMKRSMKAQYLLHAAHQHVHPKRSLSLVPSKTARNLCVIIDDQLTFTAHIASVSRSCRFALYNIRKIRPYLTQYATRSSCLDYCNALLTDLPACVVKPLQMIHNATARLVFNQLKRAHVTPLLLELHWLPVAACIKFKLLMLAYRVIAGSALIYLNALVRANVTPRMLRSSYERQCVSASHQLR